MCPAEQWCEKGRISTLDEGVQGLYFLPDGTRVRVVGEINGFRIGRAEKDTEEGESRSIPLPKTRFYDKEVLQLAGHEALVGAK